MTDAINIQQLEQARNFIHQSQYQDALVPCAEFLEANPDHPYGIHLLAIIAFLMGDNHKALNLLEKLHETFPDCREVVDTLAVILGRSGNVNDSLYYAKLATVLETDQKHADLIPVMFKDYAAALNSSSNEALFISPALELDKGRYQECIRLCKNHIKTNPNDWDMYYIMARAFRGLHSYDDALTSLHTGLAGNMIAKPEWQIEVGDSWTGLGHLDDAFNSYLSAAKAAKGHEEETILLSRIMVSLSKIDRLDHAQSKAIVARLNELTLADIEEAILMGGGEDLDGRKIRVAYLSDSFFDCEKGEIILSALSNHDKSKFEIFCYQQNSQNDATTGKMRNVSDDWREIRDLDDLTAAYLITCDGIDILIDCIGISENQRLNLVAQKPAPVVLSWLNDLPSDQLVETDRTLNNETMNNGGICYDFGGLLFDMNHTHVDKQEAERAFVYATHCDLANVTTDVIMAWNEILTKDTSANILVGGKGCNQRAVRQRYSEIFMNSGIANRIFFQNLSSEEAETSALMNTSDVLLCTAPQSNARTAAMALSTGTPVVALQTEQTSIQSAVNVLKAAGKEDWIASDIEAYANKAIELAKLNVTNGKKKLADDMQSTNLFNQKNLAQEIERNVIEALKDKGCLND
ncbi:hypothetical protein MTBPR1_70129 [Candidatus Terasakiella magnetica]|uniref:O-GlcNAc transferase C-terminal domain-containing protein n=1 Tax=Candidatus Terasakiella magnetica TaxID=1867952 RepID=A0A1C3RKR1_9PROT|nr:hypothetical protein [Candidatus Terasakiella magnetica]SCA57857.1 hypothetical protein MTBPR1_70129 [Candidatus Terasakiella magnetica]